MSYRVIQTQKSILGDRPPEKEPGWNTPEYIELRKAFAHLGYDICEVNVVSDVWHRSKHLDLTYHSLYKHDSEAIRVHYRSPMIWITPYDKYASFDVTKPWEQLAKDIQYYFGHGSLDY